MLLVEVPIVVDVAHHPVMLVRSPYRLVVVAVVAGVLGSHTHPHRAASLEGCQFSNPCAARICSKDVCTVVVPACSQAERPSGS